MEGIGRVLCKVGISETEGTSLDTFKDWGIHLVRKPCLEHGMEYACHHCPRNGI